MTATVVGPRLRFGSPKETAPGVWIGLRRRRGGETTPSLPRACRTWSQEVKTPDLLDTVDSSSPGISAWRRSRTVRSDAEWRKRRQLAPHMATGEAAGPLGQGFAAPSHVSPPLVGQLNAKP